LDKRRIVYPAALCDQTTPQVRNQAPADASRANHQKRGEDLVKSDTSGWGRRLG
jgi:hypothetical protein